VVAPVSWGLEAPPSPIDQRPERQKLREPRQGVSSRQAFHVMKLVGTLAKCGEIAELRSARFIPEIPVKEPKSSDLAAWIALRRSATWTTGWGLRGVRRSA
jgi:hypothetical protein